MFSFIKIFTDAPYLWLFLIITIILTVFVVEIKNNKAKEILFNLSIITFFLFVGEVICLFLNIQYLKTIEITSYNPGVEYSDKLGYVLPKNTKIHSLAKINGKTIYDVNYKINNYGLRNTNSSNNNSCHCIFFFGCSMIFGQGINDNETLPYLLGEKTNHKYRIYNFGVGGYGPNQILYEIESGGISKIVKGCKDNTAIYMGVENHVERATGKLFWQKYSPKYDLIKDKLVYQKSFESGSNAKLIIDDNLKSIMQKSQIYICVNRMIFLTRLTPPIKEKQKYEKLYIVMLGKMRNILKEKYNTKRFIVLFWDDNYSGKCILKSLDSNTFENYSVCSILPGFNISSKNYLIQNDGHPNKHTNEVLANFLAKKIKK